MGITRQDFALFPTVARMVSADLRENTRAELNSGARFLIENNNRNGIPLSNGLFANPIDSDIFFYANLKVAGNASFENNATYQIASFFEGETLGGGFFKYNEAVDKSTHNGVTVIDPDRIVAWSGTRANLNTYFSSGSGLGCLIRYESDFLSFSSFGAIAGEDNTVPWEQVTTYANGTPNTCIKIEPGTFAVGFSLFDGATNLKIKGSGKNSTTIFLNDGINNHLLAINNSTGIEVSELTLDQNSAGNSSGHGFRTENISNLHVFNIKIKNTVAYGFGHQELKLEDAIIENILIENTGNDGIDIKNTDDNNKNVVIKNVSVSQWGQSLTDKAAIDLRGQVNISSIYLNLTSASNNQTGVRLRRGELSDPSGLGAHNSIVSNIIAKIDTPSTSGTVGVEVEIGVRDVEISNLQCSGFAFGLTDLGKRTSVTNANIKDANVEGVSVQDDGSRLSLVTCENCGRSIDIQGGSNTVVIGAVSINPTNQDYRVQGGVLNTVFIGCQGVVGDSGTGTQQIGSI